MKKDYPPVLDVCCGPRSFWYDKNDVRALFIDKRCETIRIEPGKTRPCGETIAIQPDEIGDFSSLRFPDNTFYLVVFDPPHIVRNSYEGVGRILNRYGHLSGDWEIMIRAGFSECFRVLKPNGVLVFKWHESSIRVCEILKLTTEKPLFGNHRVAGNKTHWITFIKNEDARAENQRSRPNFVQQRKGVIT